MVIDYETVVIFPKGSLTNRISVMVSAIVLSNHLNTKIKMLWDHSLPYDYFYMDNIELVEISYFSGKKYIYNPNISQSELYNNIKHTVGSNTYLIIETDEELVHKDMLQAVYLIKKKEYYLKLLNENMGGMLLGQLNLIDFPHELFCCVSGGFETKLPQFVLDEKILDINTEEVKEYVRILCFSKAIVLINTQSTINKEMLEASKISLVPVVHTEYIEYDDSVKNYAIEFLDYKLVINPDVKKISLL
jgi:hypothetical protein